MAVANENWFAKSVRYLKGTGIISTDKEVADRTGYSPESISNMISGRVPVSEKFNLKFNAEFGKHLKESFTSEPLVPYGKKIGIPFFEIDVTAHPIQIFNDGNEYADFFIDVPMFRDCDLAVRVYGNSMQPAYNNGE